MPSLTLTPTVEVTPAAPPIIELTLVNNTPTIDVITFPPATVEVSAIGLQGPPGFSPEKIPTVEAHDFSIAGPLTARAGNSRVYFDHHATVISVFASVATAPAGAPVRVDVKKNGASLYTNPAQRLEITPGANVSANSVPAVTTFTAGDYMTVDVLQTGTTVPGSFLTVTVRTQRD